MNKEGATSVRDYESRQSTVFHLQQNLVFTSFLYFQYKISGSVQVNFVVFCYNTLRFFQHLDKLMTYIFCLDIKS